MKRLMLCLILVNLIPAVQAKDKNKALETLSKLAPLLISNDQIGLWFSQGLEQEYGLLKNEPQVSNRLQQVGSKILSVISEPNAKYDFAVLASNDFNAVSIYGGRVRVFKGLLYDTRNSNGELAAVVAHEIAHQERGHNQSAVKTFKIATLLGATNLDEKMPQILKLGAVAALAKRSRKHEKEADSQALEWMSQAGFNPRDAIAVFRRIEAEHKLAAKRSGGNALSNRFARIFATHPEPAKRVEAAEDYLFRKKYGWTFKMVAGDQAIPLADNFIQPTDTFVPSPISQFGSEWVKQCSDGVWKLHCGVDVDLRQNGKIVKASANGIVRYADSFGEGWGKCVILEHDTRELGPMTTLYGHIIIADGIQKDKTVQQGDVLGTIDPAVVPPHLHFGVRLNPYDDLSIRGALFACTNESHQPKFPEKWVDPIKFLKDHAIPAQPITPPDKVLVRQGPVHLGDDVQGSQIEDDATFDYAPQEAILKLRVKGTPNKDPIIWVNRQEVGRIVTTDDKWHWYEFRVPKEYLREGKNLYHIEAYIPDRWQTFDDCEVADVYILKK